MSKIITAPFHELERNGIRRQVIALADSLRDKIWFAGVAVGVGDKVIDVFAGSHAAPEDLLPCKVWFGYKLNLQSIDESAFSAARDEFWDRMGWIGEEGRIRSVRGDVFDMEGDEDTSPAEQMAELIGSIDSLAHVVHHATVALIATGYEIASQLAAARFGSERGVNGSADVAWRETNRRSLKVIDTLNKAVEDSDEDDEDDEDDAGESDD